MADQVSSLRTGIKYKNTPIGKIPVDWEVSSIDKICTIRRGASPRPIGDPSFFSNKGRGWIRISDVTNTYKYIKKTSQYLSEKGISRSVKVNPGDLIMSICATIGKPILIAREACIHDGFVLFSNISEKADPEYLFYLLHKNERKFAVKGKIGTQGNLNTGIVKNTIIPLPQLLEQKKIAEILSSVDEAIEKTTQIIEKTEELKEGLAQRLFSEGIGHSRFKETEFGTFPNISRKELESQKIVIPLFDEQQEIATILEQFDTDMRNQKDYKKLLEEAKKALVQVLLTGKLRVNL